MATPEILLVDGDPRSRAALALGLDRRGFLVAQAASASEALSHASRSRPSLIVSELELPDGGGVRLVELLRRSPQTEGVPLFVLSGDAGLDVAAAVRLRGADEVLHKPIHVSDLAVLARIATSPDPRSFAGSLDALRPPHLLRALTSGGRGGRISVGHGDGRILFREGRIVDAFYRHLRGEAALLRMLTLTSGPFLVEFVPVNRGGEIDFGLREVLTRGFPHVRRWEQIVSSTYPLDTRLEIDFAALRRVLVDLPDEVNRVVRLFDGKRTLMQVIDASGFDDLTALEVVGKLDALHVLRPVSGEARSPFLVPADASLPAADALLSELFGEDAAREGPLPEEALDWFADYVKGEGTWDEILPGEDTGGWVEMPAGKAVGAALIAEAIEETLGELKEPRAEGAPAQVKPAAPGGRFDTDVEPEPLPLTEAIPEQVIELSAPVDVPLADRTPPAPLPLTDLARDLLPAADSIDDVELQWTDEAPGATAAMDPEPEPVIDLQPAPEGEIVDLEPAIAQDASPVEPPIAAQLAEVMAPVQPLDIDPEHEPFFDGEVPADAFDTPAPAGSRGRTVALGLATLVIVAGVAWLLLRSPSTPGPALPPPAPPVASATEALPELPGPLDMGETDAAASARKARALALAVQAQDLYRGGDVTQAVRLAEDALSVDPASVPAGVLLGQVEVEARHTERAIEVLEHVRQVDPANARAAVLLGFAYQTAGRLADAVTQYREYLALEPEGESVAEVKAILARLGG